jgi:transposase
MIGLTHGVKIYLCTSPADMRRGFDGLSGMAQTLMQQDPLSATAGFDCENCSSHPWAVDRCGAILLVAQGGAFCHDAR